MPQTSEFAKLSDLALKQGYSHSELLSEIHDKVLSEYKKIPPDKPQTVEVVVNEKSGEVHLMRDNVDVTPEGFSTIAEKVTREVVIEKLAQNQEQEPIITIDQKEKPSGLGKWIINILFWGYNLLYIFILFIFISRIVLNPDYRNVILETI